MVNIIVIPPNNTEEQNRKALRNVERVVEEIILKEYGLTAKVTLTRKD